MPFSVLDEEIIFRSWDGDILKVSTDSNETDLLLKNTTFVSLYHFYCLQSMIYCTILYYNNPL